MQKYVGTTKPQFMIDSQIRVENVDDIESHCYMDYKASKMSTANSGQKLNCSPRKVVGNDQYYGSLLRTQVPILEKEEPQSPPTFVQDIPKREYYNPYVFVQKCKLELEFNEVDISTLSHQPSSSGTGKSALSFYMWPWSYLTIEEVREKPDRNGRFLITS